MLKRAIVQLSVVLLIAFTIGCSPKNSGEKLVLNDSTKNSVEQLSELIKQNPQSADLYFDRASLYMKKGNGSSALNDMLNAVKIDSVKSEYFLLLGDIYFSKLFIAQAISSFEKSIALDPKNIAAELRLAELSLYLKKYQDNDSIDTAGKLYQKILETTPDYKDALFNLGYIHLVYKLDYENAAKYFNAVCRLDTGDVRAFYNRGLSFEQMKKKDLAEADFRKALQLKPDYELAKEGLKRLGKK